jgi:hypothetical protein
MKFSTLIITGFSAALLGCTTAQINSTTNALGKILTENSQLSSDEVAQGLKEALTQGVSKGSAQASQLDGYYKNSFLKILMPPEMQKVNTKLRSLGFNKLMDDFELSLNRGAEEAAKEAKPIFVNAITSMTIQDAWNILKGEPDAATVYLKKTTNSGLYNAFKPVIQNSLQKVNATKYYTDIITTYNKIPLVEKVNPDLNDYVTNKAIDGLFVLVKDEEANIRSNPSARATELLKKVFTPENMKKQ